MKIALLEPYFTGSHKQWAESFKASSKHEIKLFVMKGNYWKWRMHGGAITLAEEFNASKFTPDFILATDMLNFSTFLSLIKCKPKLTAIYFHENQLTYPWSPADRDVENNRDMHYGFINIISALSSDAVFFNSSFHKNSFLIAASKFIKSFPDYNSTNCIEVILKKSATLNLGINLKKLNISKSIIKSKIPIILWNHRWEYDKNPFDFFKALKKLKAKKIKFKLVVLGENFRQSPSEFNNVKKEFKKELLHIGYVENFNEYAKWLWFSDIIPITSNQEFFGVSCIEAVYCNCIPLLPNRLTFPSHFNDNVYKDYFYNTSDEFCKKLIYLTQNFHAIKHPNFKQATLKYDWIRMSKKYDDTFQKLLNDIK